MAPHYLEVEGEGQGGPRGPWLRKFYHKVRNCLSLLTVIPERGYVIASACTQLRTHADIQSNTSASGSYIDPMGSTAISHIANLHASVDGTQNLAPHF